MILFLLTAVLEIAACYFFLKGNYWLSMPMLVAFAYTMSLQTYEPAKAYLIYGGVYVVSCWVFAIATGTVLSIKDYAGIILILTGVVVML